MGNAVEQPKEALLPDEAPLHTGESRHFGNPGNCEVKAHVVSSLTPVMRRGGPSASGSKQKRNPAVASITLVSFHVFQPASCKT